MKNFASAFRHKKTHGFTLMEILVVLAIIIILASIAYPVIMKMKKNTYKAQALTTMKSLATGAGKYMQDNAGLIPSEDLTTQDTWAVAAANSPEAERVWYNAVPRMLGEKGVKDFVDGGQAARFYEKGSIFFLPGADYPRSKIMERPYFAISINTKLHRKNTEGEKKELFLSNVKLPDRTVLFLEQGLPGEKKAHSSITQGDYDGSPKGSAKSFVERYNGVGIISFFDGHAEETTGKALLKNNGEIEYDQNNPSGIFWRADPASNPNS